MIVRVLFATILFIESVLSQKCRVSTGDLIRNPKMDVLLLCPDLYSSLVTQEVVDKIRNNVCSASESDLNNLFKTAGIENGTVLLFNNTMFNCMQENSSFTAMEYRDIMCGDISGRNISYFHGGYHCERNTKSDETETAHDYFINYEASKLVSLSQKKAINKNKKRFERVMNMINDYCKPIQDKEDEAKLDLLSWSTGKVDVNYDDEYGKENVSKNKKVDPYRDESRILDSINSKIKSSKLENVRDMCKLFDREFENMTRNCQVARIITMSHDRSTNAYPGSSYDYDYTIPGPEETSQWLEALEACVEPEPYIYSEKQIPKKLEEYFTYDMYQQGMCMLENPKPYFDCFEGEDHVKINMSERGYNTNYVDCVQLLDIDPLKKQELMCYKGDVVQDHFERIEDVNVRAKLQDCIKGRDFEYCKTSKCCAWSRSTRSKRSVKKRNCFQEAVGLADYETFAKEYNAAMEETGNVEKSVTKLCSVRYLKFYSNFSSNFKQSADCFIAGPKDADGKVTACYKTVLNSLMINYDINFVACDLYQRAFSKISRCLDLDTGSQEYLKFFADQVRHRNECVIKYGIDPAKIKEFEEETEIFD